MVIYLANVIYNCAQTITKNYVWSDVVKQLFNTALKTCSGGACLGTLRGCTGAAGDTDDLVTALKYVPCVSELVDCVLNFRYLLGREMCLHLNVSSVDRCPVCCERQAYIQRSVRVFPIL
jgi:hypothetical protein